MSQWTDRIRNHAVWQQFAALGPAIDQARTRENIDSQAVDDLERVRAVLSFSGKRLAAADPFTTYLAPLDGLAGAVQNATTEVQAFIVDGSPGHLVNANSHADTALQHLAQLPVATTPEELAGLQDAVVSYRTALEEQLRHSTRATAALGADIDALKAKTAELGVELTAEKQRLSQLGADFQSQFSGAQEARSRESTDAQSARQEKFGTLITDYTQRLTEQNLDFTRQKELALTQYQADIDLLKRGYNDSAQSLLDQIRRHLGQVEKLVGVIGDLGVTSCYQKTANYARKAIWVWQVITVLALGGVIAIAYEAFIPVLQGGLTWPGFAARALVTLTVGVLAAYAASQADRYMEIERRNRKMALELEAVGPYLAPLPQDKQDEFRIELGQRSFGREESSLGRRAEKSPATIIDLLVKSKDFRDLLTEVVKAARQG